MVLRTVSSTVSWMDLRASLSKRWFDCTGAGPGQATLTTQAGTAGSTTILPDVHWNDTDGNRIEAHAAGMLQAPDSRWYWYGESSKLGATHNASKHNHRRFCRFWLRVAA